ncbi:MAG TPA: thermonuclease family protein [Kofleriaceae bacterium]|nr:thermonuclease family protein [Kofleriaceae bacterium]
MMIAAVAAGCLTIASASFASETFSAKVTGVKDGDSLVVSHKGRTVNVDLAGVHAPTRKAEHGQEARALLMQLAKSQRAEITVVRTHLADTLVARVMVDGQDLATALIKAGLGRPTTEATQEQLAAADTAKAAQTGIWAKVANPAATNAGR